MTSLCDAFLLLVLFDGQESLYTTILNEGMNGVALAEIALHGRVVWNGKDLTVANTAEIGDPVPDDVLRFIAQRPAPPAKDMTWIAEYTPGLQSGHQVLNRLVQRGVLKEVERKRWGLFSSTVWQDDGVTRPEMVSKIRTIMVDGAEPDPFTATLIFLHGVCGGQDLVVKKERKVYNRRYEDLCGDYWGHATENHSYKIPIPGLDDLSRRTIGEIAVSLGNIFALGWSSSVDPSIYRPD
jgi:hypothetical protein